MMPEEAFFCKLKKKINCLLPLQASIQIKNVSSQERLISLQWSYFQEYHWGKNYFVLLSEEHK